MRESEHCVPTSNKAVVSITPNWYDRRALDTRSNHALYHSLAHLASLCQTSPKVRESLICDGGLEQLVRIVKEGKLRRIPDAFQLPKFQQALHCLVNVGVRGSEAVRNRLVEADVVPVLLTILCFALENLLHHRAPSHHHTRLCQDRDATVARLDGRPIGSLPVTRVRSPRPIESDSRSILASQGPEVDRARRLQIELMATAPHGRIPPQASVAARRRAFAGPRPVLQVSRQPGELPVSDSRAASAPVDSDPNESDEVMSAGEGANTDNEARIQEFNEDTTDARAVLLTDSMPVAQVVLGSPSSMHDSGTATNASRRVRQAEVPGPTDPTMPASLGIITRMPTTWDQDVALCLRLLAYLTKYPYLRQAFSKSHDVPRLRQNLKQFEVHSRPTMKSHSCYEQMSDDLSESLKIPCNVFQIVEYFTMRIHTHESAYWAGVIMRSSCRRYEQKGGIRQCAYLECGAWETQNRQFAKCRRCRRTKYCSKACQSKAWIGHRYWCSSSSHSPDEGETASA